MSGTKQYPKKRETKAQEGKRIRDIKQKREDMGYDPDEKYKDTYVRKADRDD